MLELVLLSFMCASFTGLMALVELEKGYPPAAGTIFGLFYLACCWAQAAHVAHLI